ncbi:unnamed protein product [Prorocentrum cordatum]|uniref:Uncharacterized protein n=1 Tax=Prorocentrum cordatum TaxID=2364126 RepID=A0ABN9VX96_9DINO|nr:unnamed protein product [Polarella glacialis]
MGQTCIVAQADLTVEKNNFYSIFCDALQTWARLPFPTSPRKLAGMSPEDMENFKDSSTAGAIKEQLGNYLDEYRDFGKIKLYRAKGANDPTAGAPVRVPQPRGNEIKNHEFAPKNARLFVETTEDPVAPETMTGGEIKWPGSDEPTSGPTTSKDGSANTVCCFIQEIDDWLTIELPPRTVDISSPGGRGATSPPHNVAVLKKRIASSMKWKHQGKVEASNIRIYRADEHGQAAGRAMKGNIMISTTNAHVAALYPSTEVEVYNQIGTEQIISLDSGDDGEGPQ